MQLTLSGLALLLGAVPVFLSSAYEPRLARVGGWWMAAVVLLALLDALVTRRVARVEALREVDAKLSLGAANRVRIKLRNRSRWPLKLQVKDSPPVRFRTPERMRSLSLEPFGSGEVTYVTTPLERGDFTFGDLYLRGRGRLGLTAWQRRLPATQEVKVYPNLVEVERYDLLARSQRLTEVGFHALRQRGEGTQFESLREYVPDDEFRSIDWKATARRGKPITRQYEVERSQNVILMLDTGRMMRAQVSSRPPGTAGGEPLPMSKLDHGINAALLLAHVAVAHDDAVGLVAFGSSLHCFLPPRKGRAQIGRLVDQMYALQPALEEPDYPLAFSLLTQRSRKRALVVVFTDLVDADASQRLLAQLVALRPRYLPLLVTLRDGDLERVARGVPAQVEGAYQKAVAGQVLAARETALARLRARGVLVVDVPAGTLSVAAVNEYLRLKNTGRL
ncbi:DUF58 domain-containing protein [bacterium]|nr:DUF58 domain-containing protein [bacterium]